MECESENTVMAYTNNLVTEVGKGPRFTSAGLGLRFGLGGARLQLMGCALHYMRWSSRI
jgi:hypothetical protein